LNLFALIDRTARNSDLQWQDMLDTELGSYKNSFLEELMQTSKDIRSRIREDLEKNKYFYEQPQEDSSTNITAPRASISRQENGTPLSALTCK